MFSSLLIANRGEIACRVMATARRLGLRTIAVYSEADKTARHVMLADEAHFIGPPPAAQSYLNIDAIIQAAKDSGAEAIHPGYGFLAENAGFAALCQRNAIVFVGPPANAIRVMGAKDAAKALMTKAGVAVVPGYDGGEQSVKALGQAADAMGYPVLIKAVAGGGGKGMRRVDRPADFKDALAGAKREAKAAFGDDRILLEKFLPRARHIEVQVFADRHGQAVHLFERDCSAQRRHQKVIEEAPAPGVDDALRRWLGATALKAVKAVGYEGAGTVEFIADISDGLRQDRIYFMEMNTRLQVEHGVTEMITGLDLVEWQLRVAAGEKLPARQADIVATGHAVEARLYAEDPSHGFVPSPGTLRRLRFDTDGVRIDSGVGEGDTVTSYYDPMIAKLIAHGVDRAHALTKLRRALAGVEIAGIRHNAGFLARVIALPRFQAGDVDTRLIDAHLAELTTTSPAERRAALALAALSQLSRRRGAAAPRDDPHSPWGFADGWRLVGSACEQLDLMSDDDVLVSLEITRSGASYAITFGGETLSVAGSVDADGTIRALIDGHRITGAALQTGDRLDVMVGGDTHTFNTAEALHLDDVGPVAADAIVAPLPGKIAAVLCRQGDAVTAGAPLVVLEAMKMEHRLTCPRDGVVAALGVTAGDQVEEGRELVRLEPPV